MTLNVAVAYDKVSFLRLCMRLGSQDFVAYSVREFRGRM